MTKPCPGPLPVRASRHDVPAGACDTHFHVLGPLADFPLSERRFYTPPEAGPAMAIDRLRAMQIARAVVVQATVLGGGAASLIYALEALRAVGIDVRGVAGLPLGTASADLARLSSAGICGQRITGLGKGPITRAEVTDHAEIIADAGWHLDFLPVSLEEWLDLMPVLSNLSVPLVIDHMASKTFDIAGRLDQPGFAALLDLIRRGNTWVKISSGFRFEEPPYPQFSRFVRALAEARPDRLLWGTDWPHVALWDRPMVQTTDTLDWLWDIGFDADMRRQVLVETPAQLYGFE